MSKMRKRFLPVLLAASMVCGSVSPAYAADLFSADEKVEFKSENADAAKGAGELAWNYSGINYGVTVEVGSELTPEQFIEQTNAKNCVMKNNEYLNSEDVNISFTEGDYQWNRVNTGEVNTYIVGITASYNDDSTWPINDTCVIVQDTTAPQWIWGNVNYHINIPVGSPLMIKEDYFEATNINNSVTDNSGVVSSIIFDEWKYNQIDTSVLTDNEGILIQFNAYDEAGNKSGECGTYVHVVDEEAPEWNSNAEGINFTVEVPVGTTLEEADFIEMTNARVGINDNYTSRENMRIVADSCEWSKVDTNTVDTYDVHLFAYDESDNVTPWGLGITVKVVDAVAPEWDSNAEGINFTVEVPVGTTLEETDFIEMTNARVGINDNYTSRENMRIVADSYEWSQVDTNTVDTYDVHLFAYDESDNVTPWGLWTAVKVVPATKSVTVKFQDETSNEVIDSITKTVPADETKVNYNSVELTEKLKVAKYKFARMGDESIVDNEVTLLVRKTTKKVAVVFCDRKHHEIKGGYDITVDADARLVNTNTIKKVPEGYKIAIVGDLEIKNGKIYVTLDKATKKVAVVFRDRKNHEIKGGYEITVDADARLVNTNTIKKVPEGYKIAIVGDLEIKNGKIYVTLDKATKKVAVVFRDRKNHEIKGGYDITVDADARLVNTNTIKKVPEGYKIAIVGDLEIKNGKIYVTLDKATKKVAVVFRDRKNHEIKGGYDITVDADARVVNTNTIKKVPEGYKIAIVGDLEIKNGKIYVTLDKATKKVAVVFRDRKNHEIKGGYDITVDADARVVNTNTIKKVPEGYKIAIVGDLEIKNGKIYVTLDKTTRKVNVVFRTNKGNVILNKDLGELSVDTKYVKISTLKAPKGYSIVSKGYAKIYSNGNAYVTVKLNKHH